MAMNFTCSQFLVRVISISLIIIQAGILDWYLGYYGGKTVVGWLIADVFVLALFIASYLLADSYFKQLHERLIQTDVENPSFAQFEDAVLRLDNTLTNGESTNNDEHLNGNLHSTSPSKSNVKQRIKNDGKSEEIDEPEWSGFSECDICKVRRRASQSAALQQIGHSRRKYKLGALPLSYVSWAFYSIILISKMHVIFLTFGDELDERLLFGTNMLELAFVATAGVFGLVLVSHRKVPKKKISQRLIINYMQNQALMDIVDSVEMLYFLFDHGSDHVLNIHVRNAILALVSIQLIIPTLGFYRLSMTNFADEKLKMFWSMLQQFINIFGENVPFLVIRIYMWTNNQHTGNTFVFVAKNIVEICTNQWDFVGWGRVTMADCCCKNRLSCTTVTVPHTAVDV